MAITLDAQTVSSTTTNQNSLSFSHTCAADATVLLVMVGGRDQGGAISTVTYNGVGCTQVQEDFSGLGDHAAVYYLLAPASGSNTVVVTIATGNFITWSVQAVSLKGTLTSAAVINTSNGTSGDTSTPISVVVTSTVDGCWFLEVVSVAGNSGPTITQGAESGRNDWSPDWEYEPGGVEAAIGGTNYQDEATGAKTFSWAFTGDRAALAAVAVAPSGVAVRVPRYGFTNFQIPGIV